MQIFVRASRVIRNSAHAAGGMSTAAWFWLISFITIIIALWVSTEMVTRQMESQTIIAWVMGIMAAGILVLVFVAMLRGSAK